MTSYARRPPSTTSNLRQKGTSIVSFMVAVTMNSVGEEEEGLRVLIEG